MRKKKQRGAALVEGALVLIALLFTIIFIVEMGRMEFLQQVLTERARAGVRYAVVNTYSSSAIQNYVVYNDASGSSGTGLYGLTTSMVSVTESNTTTDQTNYTSRVQVKISNYPLISNIPGLSGILTLPAIVATALLQSMGATN